MSVRAVLLFGAFAIGATTAANAGTMSASQILDSYNAVIFGNATTGDDIEGGAIIGGSFSGATVYNNPVTPPPSGDPALAVFGATSGNPINIDNGGSAYVAGNHGSTINFNGGGSYATAPGYTIANLQTTLTSLSQTLSSLAATSTLPQATNNEVIKAIPGANGIAVFNITAAQLAAIPSFKINLNGASTVVFNVSGTSATFSANDESGTTGANDIIWNFYDATGTVALNTQIGGTVLAPDATVTNSNQIDGVLVANKWTGNGELHDWAFTGTLPSSTDSISGTNDITVSSVPEPASAAILAVGAAAAAFLRRKRA